MCVGGVEVVEEELARRRKQSVYSCAERKLFWAVLAAFGCWKLQLVD